ncbi:hypothetical protein O159_25090 [Leifsonia xyli subsp. cynodontis DSM 46306]|uniref:HTH cro/C1-type domain-containing protein n=1 Tax=Leifsonia xyli subsp. cynodontis DSM 46306 TaxID=1389489 RepID=U3PFM1_LEIXC|nr:helix-turn-helix domain-containing protein [Leifsonia xyli]AGW42443.1 hypothetical protein O159_25090 [Leifsonia xyli subsp. cynodontis DSM 46306]
MFIFDHDLASYLDRAIAAELTAELTDAGLNAVDLVKTTGLKKDTVYRILNSRRSCTMVEFMTICSAIPADPYELIEAVVVRARRIRRAVIERAHDIDQGIVEHLG